MSKQKKKIAKTILIIKTTWSNLNNIKLSLKNGSHNYKYNLRSIDKIVRCNDIYENSSLL